MRFFHLCVLPVRCLSIEPNYRININRVKNGTLEHGTFSATNQEIRNIAIGPRSQRRSLIAIKSTQVFLVAAVLLMTLFITVLCIGFLVRYEVKTTVWNVDSAKYWKEELSAEQKFWYNDGIEELKAALKIDWERQFARNLIIFVTNGIGDAALAAARHNAGSGQTHQMIWDDFPHIGQIVTHCKSTSVCDAYTLGTTLFGGVGGATKGVGGLDSAIPFGNCIESMNETHHVKSILRIAQSSDFRNGFVTTRRVSGPLMSSLYAFSADTSWECDTSMPASKLLQGCKDIATQLIDDETGNGMNVIMGGGRQTLVSSTHISDWDPLDAKVCNSRDGRNYLRDWRTFKRLRGEKTAVVENSSELRKLNASKIDFVMGIFANGNVKPSWQHVSNENSMPDLSDMVEKALDVLHRKNERFIFVVESGSELEGDIGGQIKELKELNATIQHVLRKISDDTLLVTLFLENGTYQPGTTSSNATLPRSDGVSGNIKILALGPNSNLFRGVRDETYLAHALSYALKIGTFQKPV